MKTIEFLTNYSKYRSGDKAEFKAAKADYLILIGFAKEVEIETKQTKKMKVIFLKKYGNFAAGQVATIDKAKAEGLVKFGICKEVKDEPKQPKQTKKDAE